MKKVLAAVAVVCVVCVAGAALAQPRAREEGRRVPPQVQQGQRQDFRQPQPRPQGQPGHFGQQFNGAPCFCGRNDNRRNDDGRRSFNQRGQQGMHDRFDGRGPRDMMFTPDMPDEIRETAVKIAKLRVDLEAALAQKPIDKAAALEAFTKINKLEQEIEVWRFEKKLDQMEAFRAQQELNRKMPPAPAPKPEAPAPEAPAPEASAE